MGVVLIKKALFSGFFLFLFSASAWGENFTLTESASGDAITQNQSLSLNLGFSVGEEGQIDFSLDLPPGDAGTIRQIRFFSGLTLLSSDFK